ncbi:hypothetical protein KIH39_05620 [Telmatocola sphagniphila]|uniref:DUF1980 domain-containing protein n=1 Tax=Telmatocola sphagniphila TaxID=1123043 RepID=A0A8E6B7X3_9BACT|nr:hypothetical protein [Telmatocola sphagniphila]QVL33391.1 hypothetical protein KIH39_05620 [Telmatocola sphagniphila]
MAHNHSHGEKTVSFYVDQLFSVAACGLTAITAVMLVRGSALERVLVKDFSPWVLGGGILLAVLVFFRMVGIMLTVNATAEKDAEEETSQDRDHGHSHSHSHSHGEGEECQTDHGHSHAEHSHAADPAEDAGHADHDHGASIWRYVVLLLPFTLFCLDLPKKGFSREYMDKQLNNGQQLDPIERKKAVEGKPIQLQFNELSRAAIFPQSRDKFAGRKGILRGQYNKINDKEFALFKMDIKCCQADAVPIKARIICAEVIQNNWKMGEWVEVEGEIQFVQVKDKPNEWVPVLFLDKESQIKPTVPEN